MNSSGVSTFTGVPHRDQRPDGARIDRLDQLRGVLDFDELVTAQFVPCMRKNWPFLIDTLSNNLRASDRSSAEFVLDDACSSTSLALYSKIPYSRESGDFGRNCSHNRRNRLS